MIYDTYIYIYIYIHMTSNTGSCTPDARSKNPELRGLARTNF